MMTKRASFRKVQRPAMSVRHVFALLLGFCLCGPHAFAQDAPLRGSGPGMADAGAALDQASRLAVEGRFAEADLLLAQVYASAPNSVEVLRLYAKVEARLGRMPKALELLGKARDLAPDRQDICLEFALAYADAGQPERALTLLDESERQQPGSFLIHLNRARMLSDLKRYPEAEREFKRADGLKADDPQCLSLWAMTARQAANLAEENVLLQRWVRVDPRESDALLRLGRNFAEQGRTDLALQNLQRSYDLSPSVSSAYMLAQLTRKADPKVSAGWLEKAQMLREKQASLEQAKSTGNSAVDAAGRSQWPQAIQLYRQALAECGDCSISSGLHKNLGLALCQYGHIQEGIEELRTAYRMDPNDPVTVQALQVLHAL